MPLARTAALLAFALVAQPVKLAAQSRPDVVLVTIDTLRADALGFAGNTRVATPHLDRLAAAGRVFPNAHAHNVVTLPSHANLLTGLYPHQHGIRDNTGFVLPAGIPTLATVLQAAGYATGAFVGAYPLDSRFGLARGFDVYDDRTTQGAGEHQFVLAERRGDEVVASALEWWRRQRGRPRFLWVHLYDPHARYDPPEPFASRYRNAPYLGEVAAVDAFLGPLLVPHLEGREPAAVIAVTADHGEALGEHGETTHGLFAYEATLRVPLVLWGRGVARGRDGRWARHVDLFPTLLAAAGVAPPARPERPARPGRSLLAPWSEEPDSYFEALSAALNRGWAPLRGLLRPALPGGPRKFIALPLPEVYDVVRDAAESRNLVDTERRAARAAFDLLPAASAWPPPRTAPSGEEEARMLALGYAGSVSTGPAAFAPEDDPKRLVHLDRTVHALVDAYSRGELETAIRLARELVAARPMALGHSLLANALLEAGRRAEALAVMEKARAGGLASDALLRQLGLTLAETGRADEAVAVLRPLAERGDVDAMNALAVAHSETGRQREAFETLQRALARDPDNAKSFELIGLVELRLGRWAQARDASRRAVERRAGLPHAWNNLGVASWQLGEAAAALDAWQRAVELDPRLWDAQWNLGVQGSKHGRHAVARAALERFVAGAPAARYAKDVEEARRLLARLPSGG